MPEDYLERNGSENQKCNDNKEIIPFFIKFHLNK